MAWNLSAVDIKALAALETVNDSGDGSQKGSSKKKDGKESATPAAEPEIAKWLEREWLQRWSQIQPRLGETDLRVSRLTRGMTPLEVMSISPFSSASMRLGVL